MKRIQSSDVKFFDSSQEIDFEPVNQTKQHKFLREVFEAVYLPNQSYQTFRERVKQHRIDLQRTNLHGFSYSRAHHYHFYLEQFPRIPGQPTYALDMNNSFRSTYSQQDKLYKGDRLGNIVNRVAFTLPKRQQFFDLFGPRKRGSTHNKAHDQLFSIQNSKINLDLELLTCRKILKNLQRLTENYRLWHFQLVNQRVDLEFLLDQNLPLEEKKQKLESHIALLQQKKANMIPVWQANDEMFLFSSLQQKLHDRICYEQNMEVVQASNRVQFYINKHKNLVESLTKEDIDLDNVLGKIFSFVNSKVVSISQTQMEILKAHISKINKPLKTALPFLIFNFGKPNLRQKVNRIITKFIENKEISIDQECKSTLTKLFKGSFEMNQLGEQMGSYEAKVMTKTMRNRLKRQMESNKDKVEQVTILDDYINQRVIDEPVAERQECLPILKLSKYKVQICEEEMQMLFYYNAVCKAVSLFEPLIHQDQTVMNVLCSPYLDHLMHGIIGHIPNKMIGQLINNLRHLVEHAIMSNCVKENYVFTTFQWEFSEQTGLGLVWSEPKKPSQGKNLSHFYSIMIKQQNNVNGESDVRDEEQEELELASEPSKKVKQNQQQN